MKELYNKYKEYILYLVFGGLTTVVNLIIYYPLVNFLHIDYLISNVVAWIGAVTFAYVTNRLWVFDNRAHGAGIITEFIKFCAGRLFSLGVQTLLLYLMVQLCHISENIAIIPAMFVVVVLNYVISKLFVFKKDKSDEQ